MTLLLTQKAELAQKARKEIADYLAAGKDERARIRVEHIIREDYMVEAMEILELYCDLLLSRLGLIQSMKYVTPVLRPQTSQQTLCIDCHCFASEQGTRPWAAGGRFHSHLGCASPYLGRA